MTGDELAAAVYTEQGFLVIASTADLTIGQIVFADEWVKGTAGEAEPTAAIRILARSSHEEFIAQMCRLVQLDGLERSLAVNFRYFYRTEAAD